MSKNNLRAGGQILADQLRIQGVEFVFCVPGESHLALLDGLYEHRDSIDVISTRQEGGASNMAEAYAKLTGQPGICLVTRGPGATNASIGIHTAFQDSSPVILLIGQVGRDMMDREAFQEMDYRRMFGEMAKWVAQIDDAARIPEYISHAFHVATSGRPGPVVLALPEDMLRDEVEAMDSQPIKVVRSAPTDGNLKDLQGLLKAAERPLVIVGGPTWTTEAVADITRFVEANGLPATASFRSQDCFNNLHPNYIGDVGIGINPKLAQRIKDSDLLIVIGPRLGEMTTSGYTLLEVPIPKQKLVHVHTGVEELGRVYQPTLAINASMPEISQALADLPPVDGSVWAQWLADAHNDYLGHIVPTKVPGSVNFGEIVSGLNQSLPEDAIITCGAGNYTVWVHRFFQHKQFRTQLAPTSGAMGYGVPSAIAAKLKHPERTVVSFSGDGCFLIHGQELATAVQYKAAVIFVIANNGMYGTIRMHQERHYPERVIGTDLVNPDFAELATAYGAHGERVTRTQDFAAAFECALQSNKPAVIELVIDPEALTPRQSLSEIRAAALA